MKEKLNEYVDKWVNVGLSTDKCDADAAIKAIKELYVAAGLNEPTKVIFTNNPLDAVKEIALIRDHDKNITRNLRYGLERDVNGKIASKLTSKIKKNMAYIKTGIDEKVTNPVFKKLCRSFLGKFNVELGFGNHDAYFLGVYDYLLNELDLKECERLIPYMDLAKNCGWFTCYSDIAILQGKPSKLIIDENNNLGDINTASVEYLTAQTETNKNDRLKLYFLDGEELEREDWIKKCVPLQSTLGKAILSENAKIKLD